jgi:hypothetical protein
MTQSPEPPHNSPLPQFADSGRTPWKDAVARWGAVCGIVALISAVLGYLAVSTWETRKAVRSYTQMTVAVNAQDLDALRKLCTRRYLSVHTLSPAKEGGVVGFPRMIHKNFQAWREGEAVWVCPTNRVGPIYQFLVEDGQWKYDGVIGLLRSGRQISILTDEARSSENDSSLTVP